MGLKATVDRRTGSRERGSLRRGAASWLTLMTSLPADSSPKDKEKHDLIDLPQRRVSGLIEFNYLTNTYSSYASKMKPMTETRSWYVHINQRIFNSRDLACFHNFLCIDLQQRKI